MNALASEAQDVVQLVTLLRRICETPAPTFAEGERGALITKLWTEAGLEPETDCVGNVIARLPGGTGPRVLAAAHLDTVFPAATDVRVKSKEGRLSAPGIGDNSASLAVLTTYVQQYAQGDSASRPRLTLAATVGEEGTGDLYGMRQLMSERAADFDLVIAVDGHLGTVVDAAVGSKRLEITFSAKGGHSWGDYPSPSAVHALGDAIYALNHLEIPREPRSSYNIGQVWGGTSINAIAQDAGFNLDLRSLSAEVLVGLEQDAIHRINRVAKRHQVKADIKLIGDRPAAKADNAALVNAAQTALSAVGVASRRAASSTDANASLAAGLPSIAFGVYRGGDAHRLSEWLELESLLIGYKAFVSLLEAVSQIRVND